MREIAIMLSILLSSNIAHAAGLRALISAGGDEGARIVGIVTTIFMLGILGFCGAAVLNLMDKHKFGKLFERCCYVFAFALFFVEVISFAEKVVNFLMG